MTERIITIAGGMAIALGLAWYAYVVVLHYSQPMGVK